jgi:hypothetical protein
MATMIFQFLTEDPMHASAAMPTSADLISAIGISELSSAMIVSLGAYLLMVNE